eukprot:3391388-Lingulodinium_polyedra.AAC.1
MLCRATSQSGCNSQLDSGWPTTACVQVNYTVDPSARKVAVFSGTTAGPARWVQQTTGATHGPI